MNGEKRYNLFPNPNGKTVLFWSCILVVLKMLKKFVKISRMSSNSYDRSNCIWCRRVCRGVWSRKSLIWLLRIVREWSICCLSCSRVRFRMSHSQLSGLKHSRMFCLKCYSMLGSYQVDSGKNKNKNVKSWRMWQLHSKELKTTWSTSET